MNGKEHYVEMIREGQMNIFEAAYQHEKEQKKQEGLNVLNQAIEKLQKEMDANKNHAYVQVVGNFLLDSIRSNPDEASKITTDKKTIVGSLSAMEKEAKKRISGNCAVLTDEEGFGIVLGYFGIDMKTAPVQAITPVPVKQTALSSSKTEGITKTESATKNKPRFEASLEEFM